MSDWTRGGDQRRESATGRPRTAQVPVDARWELDCQMPYDEDECHDLTSAIIAGVAEAEGIPPMDVKDPPLYRTLDVAALEAAFFGATTIADGGDNFRSVEFMYRGHRIVVRSDAWIQVYRPVEASESPRPSDSRRDD